MTVSRHRQVCDALHDRLNSLPEEVADRVEDRIAEAVREVFDDLAAQANGDGFEAQFDVIAEEDGVDEAASFIERLIDEESKS